MPAPVRLPGTGSHGINRDPILPRRQTACQVDHRGFRDTVGGDLRRGSLPAIEAVLAMRPLPGSIICGTTA